MDTQELRSFSKKTVHGIFALASRSLILQLINFTAFFIISVILTARDLGIYTAVVAASRIISFFTDFGLGAALIQKKESLKREDLATIFTIQFAATLAIFLIFVVAIGQIGSFFNLNSEGSNLLLALVFTVFLSSFKMIPSILLERSINFGKLVIPQIGESLIFNFLLIALVINNFGLNSFTLAFIVSSLAGIPLYYFVSPWRPSIGIYRTSIKELKFGAQFQAKNILATVKDDFLTVILTRFLPFTQIGYIGFSQRIAFFVYRYIVDSVTKVTFSSYSRIQDNRQFLRKAIEKSLFFTGLVLFPLLFGLIVTSPLLIKFIPGWANKWEPALISLIFFSLNAIVSSMSAVLVNVLDATGRVKTTLKLMLLWTIMTWTLTPVLIYILGYNGVAISSFIITLTIFITIYLVKKVVDFNFIKSIYKPLLASFLMVALTFVLANFLVGSLATLIFVIILSGAVYVFFIYILAGKQIFEDIKKLYL